MTPIKVPLWLQCGAFVLTFIAGSVNTISLLGFEHQAISHLTGTSSFLSIAIAKQEWPLVFHLLMIMCTFVLGSALSAFIIRGEHLRLGKRYGITLFIEALLLLVAWWYLRQSGNVGHLYASAACGLQNAMATTCSRALIRTTHVSGTFTDLGIMLGHWLRGQALDIHKAWLYLLLVLGFIVGGSVGAYGFIRYQFNALALPITCCLVLCVVYMLFRLRVASSTIKQ